MRRRGGLPGRPFEGMDETTLFRTAFPEGWEGMQKAAAGEEALDGPSRERWEAVLEVARRALSSSFPRSLPVRSGADVFDRYRYLLADSPVEVFLAVLLDVKHRVLRDVRVSVGTLNGSLIHPREVFAAAVAERAAAVVLVHNHPSGDSCPSPEDRQVTRRLRSAGGIVGIPVLDHVIIGNCSFFSFREEADW
ncbi:MAG: JAB domain-containing protein [Candidatus Deferrimicrobiaceae bacterium]